MQKLTDIINMRRLPGVIILDETGTVLFMNETVSGIVPVIRREAVGDGEAGAPTIPEEIRSLCLKVVTARGDEPRSRSSFFYAIDGSPYSLRAFPIGDAGSGNDSGPRHIMVLVEPIIERHQVNYTAIQQEYGISRRQLEVLKLICLGLSNREIADRLFISEHTAKDHVKNILQIFQASSRSEVIATLNG